MSENKMRNNQEQERENYPVDAFAEYREKNDDSENKKSFGEHGVHSYNNMLGMGQDSYSTTVPVEQELGHQENVNTSSFANTDQAGNRENEMKEYSRNRSTNVSNIKAPKDDMETGHMNADRRNFHMRKYNSETEESENTESSKSGKPSGFAKVKDLMTKHHLMKSGSKNEKTRDDMNKDESMRGNIKNDSMKNQNIMKDDSMGAGTQTHGTGNMPTATMPVMMPMEVKNDNTMQLKDGRDSRARERDVADPPKTTVDDSTVTQDPIASAKSDMAEKSARRAMQGESGMSSADWNKHEQYSSGAPTHNATSMGLSSSEPGRRDQGYDRSKNPSSAHELSGAYAGGTMGNSPSMVDPTSSTYGNRNPSNDSSTRDGHANYMMHSSGKHDNRKVSVGSNNQDVDMTDALGGAPVSEEVDTGYHYHHDTIPRGQAEHDDNEDAEFEDSHKHKPGMFERIKRTLSNKSDH